MAKNVQIIPSSGSLSFQDSDTGKEAIFNFSSSGYLSLTGSLGISGSISAYQANINGGFVITGSTDFIKVCQPPNAWSAGGALSTATYKPGGAGTQNAGLAFGGYDSNFNRLTCTEEYNGTSWSAGGALSEGRYGVAGAGTQEAALAFGGRSAVASYSPGTEEYNGTSWSTGGNLIKGRRQLAGAGTQNAALAFGGRGGYTCTEDTD